MALADDLETLIRTQPGLTERQLADELFSDAYQQRVNSTCRRLIREGRVRQQGRGGAADPFRYTV